MKLKKYKPQLDEDAKATELYKKMAQFISGRLDEDGAVKELLDEIESKIGRDTIEIIEDALYNRKHYGKWVG